MAYISLNEAKDRRELGDDTIRETISAQRPTTSYQPNQWEQDVVDQRIAHYQKYRNLGQVYAPFGGQGRHLAHRAYGEVRVVTAVLQVFLEGQALVQQHVLDDVVVIAEGESV